MLAFQVQNYRGTTHRNDSINRVFCRKILIPDLQETKNMRYSWSPAISSNVKCFKMSTNLCKHFEKSFFNQAWLTFLLMQQTSPKVSEYLYQMTDSKQVTEIISGLRGGSVFINHQKRFLHFSQQSQWWLLVGFFGGGGGFFNKEHTTYSQQKTSLCIMLLCVESPFLHHSRMAMPSVPAPPSTS